ncbi:MAG: sterol desaturase family protein, partial [Saprospiraceae bacterium]
EYFASRIMGKPVNRAMDTISSLSSGMTNTLKDMLGLSVVIISYAWVVENFAFFDIPTSGWLFALAFVMIDFAAYWGHRWSHEINVFWNRHIVHHSSEEFNLACALRQSISSIVGVFFFLYIPMALVGIPLKIIAIVTPIHLFAQFWYHTRLINKMGFLEHIIVTPSHHRVHHAINEQYLDKNYAAIFIVWDKLFGTFQKELADEAAVYGVKRQVKTWNPILINWQHMWLLIQDSWRAQSWWDKIRLWFMPTGWRPEDVAKSYPVEIVNNPHKMVKYEKPMSVGLKTWAWFQMVLINLLMYFMLIDIANLSVGQISLYSTFLFISIFSYTSLMDRHPVAVLSEITKVILGIYILTQMGGWFGLEKWVPAAGLIMGTYIALSMAITVYYSFFNLKKEEVTVVTY